MFSVMKGLEEDFEASRRNNPKICHDILKVNGEGIVSQHYLSCCNIKAEDYWMNSVLTRDNSVVTENIKKATQVS